MQYFQLPATERNLNSALLYATLKLSMHPLNLESIINVYTNITSVKCILILWPSPLQVYKITLSYATACNFYSKWRREVAPLPLCKRVIDACTCNGNGNGNNNGNSGNIALWKRKKVFEQPPKWKRDGHKSRRVAMVEMLRLFPAFPVQLRILRNSFVPSSLPVLAVQTLQYK